MSNYTEDQILAEDGTPIQFIDDHEKALFHESKLGEDAIRFLDSDLGRLLRGRATLEIEDAQRQLLLVEPEDTATIRQLQFKAATARQFITWIADAIRNGDNAYDQLKAMRDN